MFCRECGKEVKEKAIACSSCGVRPLDGANYCQECGAQTKEKQMVCIKCGMGLTSCLKKQETQGLPSMIMPSTMPKEPALALILSLLLFGGVGQIYLGQVGKGIVLIILDLLFSLATLFIAWPIITIIGTIDAYLIGKKLASGKPVGRWEFF